MERQQRRGWIQSGQMGCGTLEQKSSRLGVRNLNPLVMSTNEVAWRYSKEDATLERGYRPQVWLSLWVSNEVNNTYGVGVWNSIRSFWPKLQYNTRIKVENNLKTEFQRDNCIGLYHKSLYLIS